MAVVMGAVAACTSRIKLGTSVLIAPYRHPLSDARQFATVDVLSQGRLMLGVGSGWMQEEFAACGQDYEVRNAQTDECLQIYKRSWTEEKVEFDGEFYKFDDISMDPKPLQKPHPPIVFGGNTPAGARRAIRQVSSSARDTLNAAVKATVAAALEPNPSFCPPTRSKKPRVFTFTRIGDCGRKSVCRATASNKVAPGTLVSSSQRIVPSSSTSKCHAPSARPGVSNTLCESSCRVTDT